MVKPSAMAGGAMLLAAAVCGYADGTVPARAETGVPAAPAGPAPEIAHGKVLFISYGCGWCHEGGGRRAGKCPQLMDTPRDDNFIMSRIATGSPGKMPAFGEALTVDEINALLAYIHSLTPETTP